MPLHMTPTFFLPTHFTLSFSMHDARSAKHDIAIMSRSSVRPSGVGLGLFESNYSSN